MDVMIDGVRVYCLAVGPEDHYPLIVLHGGPGLDHGRPIPVQQIQAGCLDEVS